MPAPEDDLLGVLFGCGCRKKCCCGATEEQGSTRPSTLFLTAPRTRSQPPQEDDSPFIPPLPSWDSPQRAGLLTRAHRPTVTPDGWGSETDAAPVRDLTLDDGRGYVLTIPQGAQRVVDHALRVVRWGDTVFNKRVLSEEVWAQDQGVIIQKNLSIGEVAGQNLSWGISPEQQDLGKPVPLTWYAPYNDAPPDQATRALSVSVGAVRTFPVKTQAKRGGSVTWAGEVDTGGELLEYRDTVQGVPLTYHLQVSEITFTPTRYQVEAVRETFPYVYFRARLFGWRPEGTYDVNDPGGWEEIPHFDETRGQLRFGYGPLPPLGTVFPPDLVRQENGREVYVSLPIRQLFAITAPLPDPPLSGRWSVRFRAPDVEVTPGGDAELADLSRLGPSVRIGEANAALRVNGRVYDQDGSWCGLLGPRDERWVLIEQQGECLREVIGQPDALERAPASAVCAALDLPAGRLRFWDDPGYHTWPMDRAGVEVSTTSGPRPALITVWDAWRDSTRREWSGRPRRPPDPAKPLTLPPGLRPPLGITLADVTTAGGQWEPALRGGSPHVLPSRVEVWREGRWEESEAALRALAKPLPHGPVEGQLDDRQNVRGRLRVTFPPHPAAGGYTPQPDTVLHARARAPFSADVRVNGASPEVRVLGRAVTLGEDSNLKPLRGWQPALIIAPIPYDPAASHVLEIEGLALARLLLTPAGVEFGGGGEAG